MRVYLIALLALATAAPLMAQSAAATQKCAAQWSSAIKAADDYADETWRDATHRPGDYSTLHEDIVSWTHIEIAVQLGDPRVAPWACGETVLGMVDAARNNFADQAAKLAQKRLSSIQGNVLRELGAATNLGK